MSGAGERLHIPFSQSSTSRTPSHFLDISNPKSGDAPGIPHISLLDFVRGRDDLHPPLGPQRLHAQYFGTQGVILVRDPPRERLAGSWSSAEDDEPPSILARVAGKSDFVHQYHNQHYPTATRTTTTTSASSSVEFYTDLYQYHRDQQYAVKAPFNIISNSNNSIQPAPGDEKARMMKKRGHARCQQPSPCLPTRPPP
ncbi:hypothetical protein BDZ97DRAFT_743930 [Flammula alnicola]|nr:hypothetical protein BDZ97DRAFT_743930 [Flammula alnicola]